ncbi:MFS transporter [Microcella pacifica]|uniref:MFS transporter n=1 Tax=Microcella pacifica TaxID=2591847 RepID=A0A9E5MI29_9MICO|nr:MFS transporter [Microcella pacifica]NHF63110.1 MFS transporter [Microcella pacifica]
MTHPSRPFPWVGLLTLSTAIFFMVTSEFLPTGLLPQIAADLDVSEAQVGLLITIFAGTVVLTTAPLAALTRRFDRKHLLLAVLVLFAIANVGAAIAPDYALLVVARVLGGLAHGLFWAIAGAYSGHLVPRHQIARAVAVTSGGGTAAFVLGVPAGTALGTALGWRAAFGVIAAIVLVLLVLVVRFLPAVQHRPTLSTGEITLPARRDPTFPAVLFICLLVLIVVGGQNVFYTYIAPFLIDSAGFAEASVGALLFVYGGAGAIGLVLAGFLGSRFPRGGLYGMLGVVAAAVAGVGLSAGVPLLVIALLFVWGAAFGGIPTLLQTRLLHTASARVRDVGAALLTTAFNVGIGGGAAIGGALFVVLPTPDLALVQAAIIGFGLALLVVVDLVRARRAPAVIADDDEADESSVPLITGSIVLPEHPARAQHERRDPR